MNYKSHFIHDKTLGTDDVKNHNKHLPMSCFNSQYELVVYKVERKFPTYTIMQTVTEKKYRIYRVEAKFWDV